MGAVDRYAVVSSPDPTPKRRKGSGDIGADSWFCKLSNHVIICIGLYWSTCSHVMVRTTKKRPPMSPDPIPRVRDWVWERD